VKQEKGTWREEAAEEEAVELEDTFDVVPIPPPLLLPPPLPPGPPWAAAALDPPRGRRGGDIGGGIGILNAPNDVDPKPDEKDKPNAEAG
jgi:hypothetical protein